MLRNIDCPATSKKKVAIVASLPLLLLGLTACPKNDKRISTAQIGVSERASEANQNPAVVAAGVAFNGERAMDHVRRQMDIGPRPPGTPALAKTREYIVKTLQNSGIRVTTYDFLAATPDGEKKMVNITAEIPGESTDVIVIASHYETKQFKDMLFVGANDPGASVGTLLELGRVFAASEQKPKLTYWLVFFDGEEAFCEDWDDCSNDGSPDNTYGSRNYVAELQKRNQLSRVRALILLDLMGYKNLELGRDTLSTKWLQDIIWRTAREAGHEKIFVERAEGVGGDDHEPFLKAGVPAVDLIQLNSYPYWHKATDTLDKVSPRSMKIVGDVVLKSLPKIEKYLEDRARR